MPRTLPPLNALRAFEAAGRHESFSLAAEELGVTHSSISRHVRGLEQRLQVQLFREAARGVVLSPEGREYLARILPAFDAISEATEGAVGRSGGVVTISGEPTFTTHVLMPRLGRFLAKHPDIEPRITATTALADLHRFEADVAIRSVSSADVWDGTLLSNAPLYPYAAPGHPATKARHPAELLQFRRYQDRHGDPWREWFLANGVSNDDIPPPAWRCRAVLSIEAALAGIGVLLVTSEVVDRFVQRGDLVRLFDRGLFSGRYDVLVEEAAARRKPVRVFRDWLIAETAAFRHARPE